jgi:hypothetical protein
MRESGNMSETHAHILNHFTTIFSGLHSELPAFVKHFVFMSSYAGDGSTATIQCVILVSFLLHYLL